MRGYLVDQRLDGVRAITFERLVARHGFERAQDIIEGRDAQTNADLAAWRNLGKPKATIRDLAQAFCLDHAVTLDELRGDDACRSVVTLRRQFMHEAVARHRHSPEDVARYLGDRDPSTVRAGVKTHERGGRL